MDLLMEDTPGNNRHAQIVAKCCIALGLSASLYGNIAAAWPDLVLVGFGIVASLGLPAAVALWRAIPVVGVWRRIRRGSVMLVIATSAAAYTFVHVARLQTDHGQHVVLAVCVTALVEGLVVMAILTLHAAAAPMPERTASRGPARRPTPAVKPAASSANVTKLPTRRPGSAAERAVAWLAELHAAGVDIMTIPAVRVDDHLGTNGYARKHLAEWRAQVLDRALTHVRQEGTR